MEKMPFNFESSVERFGQYPEKVQSLLWETSHLRFLMDGIDGCESPIEQMMWLALKAISEGMNYIGPPYFFVQTQSPLIVQGKKYRADFKISCAKSRLEKPAFEILVECDGHDFHEKTKEQAGRDKKRDRDFIKKGFKVIRFTGSEIFNDTWKCAVEVMVLLHPEVEKYYG